MSAVTDKAVQFRPAAAPVAAPAAEPKPERNLYQVVCDKTRNGAWITYKGKAVEFHSADDAYVYIWPERRGNGDKSRCDRYHIAEFVEAMGW